jgi:hypothetical protein
MGSAWPRKANDMDSKRIEALLAENARIQQRLSELVDSGVSLLLSPELREQFGDVAEPVRVRSAARRAFGIRG